MTVIIQFNKAEDLKLLKPLLSMFHEAGVSVQVLPASSSSAGSPISSSKKKTGGLSDKLYGILQLPPEFDYKTMLSEEALQKHSPLNG